MKKLLFLLPSLLFLASIPESGMRQYHTCSFRLPLIEKATAGAATKGKFSARQANQQDTIYPQHDFIWPVHHKVQLSASFGELRAAHFHSGVDIRSSSGRVGDRLYAAADGYVSRIKVTPSGYGKALYLTHPNGYTTVYGHMDRFTDEIETFVKREQYKRKSFALDLYLPDTLFAFRQNEYIGRMGNKGRSSGPHLHFEIRDTHTEEVIDPLAFGLQWHDRQAPRIYNLKVYELDASGREINSKILKTYGSNNRYYPKEKHLRFSSSRLAFAIEVADIQPSGNRNGISSIELYAEDSLLWKWHLTRFSFDETRYVQAHRDHSEYIKRKKRFHRCHRLPGDLMPAVYAGASDGILELPPNTPRQIELRVQDFKGNVSSLHFTVESSGRLLSQNEKIFHYFLPWDEANSIEQSNLQLYLPKGSLYQHLYLQLYAAQDRSSEYFSDVYHIHNPEVPLHKSMEIAIRPLRNIPEHLRDKLFIAYCQPNGRIVNCGGKWDGAFLKAKHDKFGDYAIQLDTTPPRIQPISFAKDMRGRKRMSFKIYDENQTNRHSKGIEWKAYVDGQWILMEYDAKSHTLTHRFDNKIGAGNHRLKLVVWDGIGNEQVFEGTFLR